MSCGKWVLFFMLFLFVASDTALLTRDTVPADLCIGWLARQAIRLMEFPGIYLFEKLNPNEFYLDQPKNRIATYVFAVDFLVYLVISFVLAQIAKMFLRVKLKDLQGEHVLDSRIGFVLGVQSVILTVGGLFAVGHVFGLLAVICGHVGILLGEAQETGTASKIARVGRAAGIILVVAWTLGIYFASPFMSV